MTLGAQKVDLRRSTRVAHTPIPISAPTTVQTEPLRQRKIQHFAVTTKLYPPTAYKSYPTYTYLISTKFFHAHSGSRLQHYRSNPRRHTHVTSL